MRRRGALIAVCLVVIAAAVSAAQHLSGPVGAPPALTRFVVRGTGAVPAANSAAMEYAEQLAADTGATRARALTYSQGTAQWDATADAVQRMDPSNFTSAYRDGVEDEGAKLVFVGRPSQAVIAVIRALPFDTTVLVGAPASQDVLADAANSADTIVRSVGLTPWFTSTDPRTSDITVTVAPGASPQRLAAGRAVVADAVARAVGARAVRTSVVVGLPGQQFQPLSH